MRSLLFLLLPCATLLAYQPASDKTAFLLGTPGQISLEPVPLPAPAVQATDEGESLLNKVQALAENGDLDAQARLGVMYYWGQDAPVDWDKAQVWLRKASERGHRDAQAKLGAMCYLGQGCTPNEAEAIKWFRKAAEQGEPYSEGCIGVMYAVGEGVPKDLLASYIWLYQAEAGGDTDASGPLEQVKKRLTPSQLEEGTRRAQAAMRSRENH